MSSARNSSSAASVATSTSKAYDRASCANRDTLGISAKTRPASSPARGPASLRPASVTQAAAPAIASTDSERIASTESPNAAIQKCSIR